MVSLRSATTAEGSYDGAFRHERGNKAGFLLFLVSYSRSGATWFGVFELIFDSTKARLLAGTRDRWVSYGAIRTATLQQ
jgi:hypothetical protein